MTVDPRMAIFDRMARTWDELPAPPDAAERLTRVVQAARLCAGDTVLDVGSGTGALLPALLEKRPRRVFAGDIAPEMLRRLRRKFAGAQVTPAVCDGAQLPIRAGAFDAVFANAVLPHFEDKPAALAEFHRVAAPGARLIISHIIGRQCVNKIHAASEDTLLRGDQVPTAEKLAAMLHRAGWRVTEAEDSADFYLVVAEKE
jgi:ubiquinone/menaquinone biosynthesis C-methylase UbiE